MKHNIAKLTRNDVLKAMEVFENSDVCIGSLRKFNEDGKPGKKTAYCIMGTLVAGTAKNRHVGFKVAGKAIWERWSAVLAINEAVLGDRNHWLWAKNDDIANKGELKKFQRRALNKLLKATAKKPLSLL